MKFIKLYSGSDNLSHFMEIEAGRETKEKLGYYSKIYPVKNMRFREFEKDEVYDWHNAPQLQYIIYLSGKVKVEASGGETRIFSPGDVLLATDLTGKGHVTTTLTKGNSIIVTEN